MSMIVTAPKTKPVDPSTEVLVSATRLSKKQPTYTGFPFVVHAPEFVLEKYKNQFQILANKGLITCTRKTTPAIALDLRMIRIAMNYGDSATAVLVYDLLAEHHKVLTIKNWL